VEESLLKTKVFIPQTRSGIVPRTRLMERLKACLNSNLVLISAPAGFGKTTLLMQWANQSQPRPRVAWVSLDEGDNDPVRFWSYLITSVQTLQPSAGKIALDLLRSSQPAPIDSVLTALINDLSLKTESFTIVLDDYHSISNKSIHNGIIFFLEHLSFGLHLVIATRADPPLPLARFRGKGLMMEIGADELRFIHDEAARFFDEVDKPRLSREQVEALNKRTEGWAVGLKMAALSARQRKDLSSFIRDFTGSQRYVLDYLVEEVLNRQTPEVRDFLLNTSILEKLCAPLCDYVTGHDAGLKMLPDLERRNLFLIPLDESREWYRYEHLFADFLRHQLGVESGGERVMSLHGRAGQWYEDNGFPDEAIDHYLTAQDWGRAIGLINANSDRKFRNGEFLTVVNWMKKLPEDKWHDDLQLCHAYAVALMSTIQLDAADAILDHIEASASNRGIDLRGSSVSLRCMIAYFRGDVSRAMELGGQALASLPPDSGDARSGTGLILAGVQLNKGLYREAGALFSTALRDARTVHNDNNTAAALAGLGLIHTILGNLHKAEESYRQALEIAGHPLFAIRSHNGLELVLYERNDLEQAEYHLGRAIELARNIGNIALQALVWAYCEMARIRLVRGDEKGFTDSIAAADRLVRNNDTPQSKAVQAANYIRVAVLRNDLDLIPKCETQLLESTEHLNFFHSHIPIRLKIARGHKAEANRQLQAMYEKAAEAGAGHSMIIARVYQSLIAPEADLAVTLLGEALTMARPEVYVRTFVDEGRLLEPLLQRAAFQGITPDYAGRLLDIIETEKPLFQKVEAGKIKGGGPSGFLLSERESAVLRQAAEGLSNKEIADKLIISLNTVKTHMRHIYDKLDVNERAQAIARARELRLL
jgi:LuxR family maltose regulon positive regulatory protein